MIDQRFRHTNLPSLIPLSLSRSLLFTKERESEERKNFRSKEFRFIRDQIFFEEILQPHKTNDVNIVFLPMRIHLSSAYDILLVFLQQQQHSFMMTVLYFIEVELIGWKKSPAGRNFSSSAVSIEEIRSDLIGLEFTE